MALDLLTETVPCLEPSVPDDRSESIVDKVMSLRSTEASESTEVREELYRYEVRRRWPYVPIFDDRDDLVRNSSDEAEDSGSLPRESSPPPPTPTPPPPLPPSLLVEATEWR
ncbi:hypothetical protein EV182_005252 [Spiromyces aspiralis]|uniref:Uncharacterized protein n=1 Tax=Spiromyces aspiralis TaxID=68401 RepID=A0ACC1HR87_9FUNG|nr:hypothetical protein EV182_005252 [Spiromyces aspiralis]